MVPVTNRVEHMQESRRIERFWDGVRRAERTPDLLGVVTRADQDEGHVRDFGPLLLLSMTKFHAIHDWHVEIDHHRAGHFALQHLQRLLTIAGDAHLVAFEGEHIVIKSRMSASSSTTRIVAALGPVTALLAGLLASTGMPGRKR